MNARIRRVHRVAAGLTQAQVAAALRVSQSHYAQIELGHVVPAEGLQRKIAAVLNVAVEELFGTSRAEHDESRMARATP
jgi:transcriptional regulator with XRE-family HTH domain